MNASVKINLLQLPGAFVQKFQARDGHTFDCVCIPIEQAMLYQTDESVYLDAQIRPSSQPKFGYDHSVRQSVPKKYYEMLTDEQRKAIPFIGNAKVQSFEDNRQRGETRNGAGSQTVMRRQEDF